MAAPVVLIDGECRFCNRAARFVIRRDPGGEFRFAALGSPAAERIFTSRGLPPPPPGTFVLVEEREAFFRSEAVLRVLGRLPAPWKFGTCFRVIPRAIRDRVYDLIAAVRYRVSGRTQSCALLTPEEMRRFLD